MMNKWTLGLTGLALIAACNDEVDSDPPGGFDAGTQEGGASRDGGNGGSGEGGSGEGGEPSIPEGCLMPADFDAPEGYPTFAVQNSDYTTASISLLDETGAILDDKYLGAATDLDGLPGGLHSDVALPRTPGEPTVLTVIARTGGDYVLRMDLGKGEVINRIATQADPFAMDDPGAAWASNPQDYLHVNETTAFVTRFAPNLDPDADALERGDDILVVNPQTGERLERLGLEDWVETVEIDDGEGGTLDVKLYARPGTLLGMGCYALFGTSRLSSDFKTGNDQGAVGVLDLREKTVTKVELDTLRNCGLLTPVTGDPERALVTCEGSNPYGDPGSAGVALLHMDADGEVEVEHILVQQDMDDPVLNSSVVSLGGTRIVVVDTGDFTAGTNDTAYVVDLDSGDQKELFTSTSAYVIGSGAYDPVRGRLYVPDAEAGVRVFEEDGDGFEEGDAIEIDALLPPRSVRPLRAL